MNSYNRLNLANCCYKEIADCSDLSFGSSKDGLSFKFKHL